MNNTPCSLVLFLKSICCLAILSACVNPQKGVEITNLVNEPAVQLAIDKFAALDELKEEWQISTKIDPQLGAEAYAVKVDAQKVEVVGGDGVGLMYGLLYLKEQLGQRKTNIAPIAEAPRFPFRAIKFNLPWDSYRNGEALSLHYETCRDTVFWASFLDMMTEHRFNKLTLWNLHPFNYLVKTKEYPEACGFSDEEMREWEQFWTTLFRMAKDRGIETYLINWNIFVSPEFARAHNVAPYCIENKHIVKQGDTSAIIKDYMRVCVRDVIDKYPDLTGLGITLGEGMGGMTADEREQWLLDSYVQGMREASRRVKFIHRVPLSAGKGSAGSTSSYVEKMTRQTLDSLTCVDGKITIELKFNWSHAYSSPKLVKVHGGKLTDAYWNPPPKNYELAWMMRNEDFFVLRWGQPDFIRNHIARNGPDYVSGYFVGSETYIPAKDYITALPGASYRYAFDRQWMYYQVLGRLLYNPATPDQVFVDAFEAKFPGKGRQLFTAQTSVSKIPLIIASYWNARWDYTLYSEGLVSLMDNDGNKVKLLSLEQMCNKQPMEPAYQSIKAYLANDAKSSPGKISPIELADSIDIFCTAALEMVQNIAPEGNTDLRYEVSDIKTWAHLGMYFSDKLRAAVAYQQFLDSQQPTHHTTAVQWLERATEHWREVVAITTPIYDPMPLQHFEQNGHELFHWSVVGQQVDAELEWLRGQINPDE